MGQGTLKRRTLLAGAACGLAGCAPEVSDPGRAVHEARWVGATHERGHRLHAGAALASAPWPAQARRAGVLILGAGVAGLAAARAFMRRGVDDVQVLELEDAAGGNARGHQLGGMACPLGAHYLPLPTPESHEVSEWLHEIGLLRTEAGRTVADEHHLCHSPQERLFFEGRWVEGLLPPAEPGSQRLAQYHRFAALIRAQQGQSGRPAFALPAFRSGWGAGHADLDRQTFAAWLDEAGLNDASLRAYLDYCCRDDYGAGIDTVSAWAGVHYFASRHGFAAPGETEGGRDGGLGGEREAVFTWPQGNGWLTQRLAAPLGARLQRGHTVLAVREDKHQVQVLSFDESAGAPVAWRAPLVVLALPLFVARRLLHQAPDALIQAASALNYAPWLIANLLLDKPLLDREGAPPAWDNVIHAARGLGYVDAMHQSMRQQPGATVLTFYRALPVAERARLLQDSAAHWAQEVMTEIEPAHPDLRRRVQRIELMRWGHAMAVPRPGLQRHPALQALRAARGRIRFAHSDLAGYSVFEEAFTAGCEVARAAVPATRGG